MVTGTSFSGLRLDALGLHGTYMLTEGALDMTLDPETWETRMLVYMNDVCFRCVLPAYVSLGQ